MASLFSTLWSDRDWWSTPSTNYLYDRPKDRTQYYAQAFISGVVPGMANLYAFRDNTAYMDDYVKNRGLDYGDIKYPSRTVGWSGYSSLGSLVSQNVSELYS